MSVARGDSEASEPGAWLTSGWLSWRSPQSGFGMKRVESITPEP